MLQLNPEKHQARYSRTNFYRHSKNIGEFLLIMSLSTGLTFLARFLPSLWIAIIAIKLVAIIYLVAITQENNRTASLIKAVAILLGFTGGIWDIAYLYLLFDPQVLKSTLATGFIVLVLLCALVVEVKSKKVRRW